MCLTKMCRKFLETKTYPDNTCSVFRRPQGCENSGVGHQGDCMSQVLRVTSA